MLRKRTLKKVRIFFYLDYNYLEENLDTRTIDLSDAVPEPAMNENTTEGEENLRINCFII